MALSFITLALVFWYGVVLFNSINFTTFMKKLNNISSKKINRLVDSLDIAHPKRKHNIFTRAVKEEIFEYSHIDNGYFYKSYIIFDPSDYVEELCTIIESQYQLLHSSLKKTSQTSINVSYNSIHKNAEEVFQKLIDFSSNHKDTNELIGFVMKSDRRYKLIVDVYQTLIFRVKELVNESNKESFTKLNQGFIDSLFSFTPSYIRESSKQGLRISIREKLEEFEEQLMNIFFGAIFDLFLSSIKNDNIEFSYLLEKYYDVVKSKIDIEVAIGGEDSIEKFTKKLHNLEISLAAWATTHNELKVLTETFIVILRHTTTEPNDTNREVKVKKQIKVNSKLVDFSSAFSNIPETNDSKVINHHSEEYLRNLIYLMIKGHELGYYEIVGYLVKVTCSNFGYKEILAQLADIYQNVLLKNREKMQKITKEHDFYHYILHEFSFEHCFKKTFTLIKNHLEDKDTNGNFELNVDDYFRDEDEQMYFEDKILAAGEDYGMLSVNRLNAERNASKVSAGV